MGILGKVTGGLAGFVLGGVGSGLLGMAAGHAFDRLRAEARAAPVPKATLSEAIVVVAAKLARADGRVNRGEVAAFQRCFAIPAHEMKRVGRIFESARREAAGFEPYARQIAAGYRGHRSGLEQILDALFRLAHADGPVNAEELAFLARAAALFELPAAVFARLRALYAVPDESEENPFRLLGLAEDAPDAAIKEAHRRLMRKLHPDSLVSQGLSAAELALATGRVAAINAAYDRIRKLRRMA